MTKKAIYAGSFDPITIGHLWMIQNAARMFDELVVAIGTNPDKKSMFSVEERLEMIRKSVGDHWASYISVVSFTDRFLVDYADEINADYIIRGIRNEHDYVFEARRLGVKVFLHEPTTNWKKDVEVCNVKNTHNVPKSTIERMLQEWEELSQVEIDHILYDNRN